MGNTEILDGSGEAKVENVKVDDVTITSDSTEPKKIGDVPYERFKEKNEHAKALQLKIDALEESAKLAETERETSKTKQLELDKQWETLATSHKAKLDEISPEFEKSKTDLSETTKVLTDYAKIQIAKVPEIYHELIENLPVLKQLEWLTNNQDKYQTETKLSGIPKTPAGVGKNKMSDDERRSKSARTF